MNDTPTDADLRAAAIAADPAVRAALAQGAGMVLSGRPARLVWASEAAPRVFGVASAQALGRFLELAQPAGARLRALAGALPPGGAARLERLRFFVGAASETVVVSVRRIVIDGAPMLLVAMPVVAMPVVATPVVAMPGPPEAERPVGSPAPVREEAATDAPPPRTVAPAPEPADPAPAAPSPAFEAPVATTEDPRPQRGAARRAARFVWETDADRRFVALGPELGAAVGASASVLGRSVDEVAVEHGLDASGAFRAALASRATWSGVRLIWPVAGEPLSAPVDLSGAPVFDAGRRFRGFRGFGVVHPERFVRVDRMGEAPRARPAPPLAAPDEARGPDAPADGQGLLRADPAANDDAAHDHAAHDHAAHDDVAHDHAAHDDASHDITAHENAPGEDAAHASHHARGVATAAPLGAFAGIDDATLEAWPDAVGATAEAHVDAETLAAPAPVELRERAHYATEGEGAEAESVETDASTGRVDEREDAPADLASNHIDDDGVDADDGEAAAETDDADDPVLAAETAEEAWAAWRREHAEELAADFDAEETMPDPDALSARSDVGGPEDQADDKADSQADETAVREDEPDLASDEPRADAANDTTAAEHVAAPDAAPVPAARPNVVPLRPNHPLLRLVASQPTGRDEPGVDRARARAGATAELSAAERNAFREIARTLGARPSDERTVADKPESGDEDDGFQMQAERDAALAEFLAELGDDPHDLRPEHEPVTPAAQSPADEEPAPVFGALATERDLITAELARNGSTMLDRLPVGVLVSRGDVPIYANRTLLDLLDFEDLESLHQAGGVAFMFRGREAERLNHVAEGGAIPVVARDGHVLSVDVRIQSIEWDGDAASLFTIRRSLDGELGQRVKTLELDVRTRQAEARELHAILDTATDGVVVLDDEGRVLAMNRSAEALFGYDQNEVAGDNFALLFSPQSQKSAADYLDGLKSNGVASVLNDGREVIGRERQGGAIPLFMTIGRISTSGPAKFCAVLRDMTHWKKAERQLEEARRDAERASAMKSDFLAKISHEIRTPLNAIIGFAEVIMEERFGPVGNERYKDYLKDIHASGAHVMSLVNDLLDLSKIEAGKLDLKFGAVDANRVVNECVSLMQAQALQERVILRVSLAPRLPQIVADERSLRQIALNVLSNALKFNEPGGQVIVSTALTDAGHAVIRIRDTGIGMSDEEIEIALEPFRQIATARQRGGTGLGLPLTKALVEANRASFTIKSKKREGTLVEIAFPPTRVLAE